MSKLEQALLPVFAGWLVIGFAYAFIGLGFGTGEFSRRLYEIPTSLLAGLVLLGWLGIFPVVAHRGTSLRFAVGVLALPGALISLESFVAELSLISVGHTHEPAVTTTYLLSPFVYARGYYRVARRGPKPTVVG
jgi:hypothetical protein